MKQMNKSFLVTQMRWLIFKNQNQISLSQAAIKLGKPKLAIKY